MNNYFQPHKQQLISSQTFSLCERINQGNTSFMQVKFRQKSQSRKEPMYHRIKSNKK